MPSVGAMNLIDQWKAALSEAGRPDLASTVTEDYRFEVKTKPSVEDMETYYKAAVVLGVVKACHYHYVHGGGRDNECEYCLEIWRRDEEIRG